MTLIKFESEPSVLREAEQRISACEAENNYQLDLNNIGLHELPNSVRNLTWITTLEAEGNKLTELPDWIGELIDLQCLNIQNNPIQKISTAISKLNKLEKLLLKNGSTTAVDDSIASLLNLKVLSLEGIGLQQIPQWLRKLRNLENLALANNQLSTIPSWLREFENLHTITLHNNPKLELPDEITRNTEAKKILNYYFRIAMPEDRHPLNEFKLVLVGRGGVGKTTLVHRLVTDTYKEFKRTPGIIITKWSIPLDGESVRAHIWDFGGQEIMHGTHRFFMTARALYVVLITGREGTEDHDAEYWLSLVRSFAGDVPVIVLLHKWDDFSFELNRQRLRGKYGRDIIFLETDSETGYGVKRLREELCELTRKLPGVKTAWPRAWRSIKEELPEQKRNWLSFDDFCAFCAERGVNSRNDQEALADFLHDLGLMLAYRRDPALQQFGVLNPQWATRGIYELLNSRQLRDAGGEFTVEMFSNILPKRSYPETLHPYLLALMSKFRLCHPLDDDAKRFLIPELLTKAEPALEEIFPADTCLNFAYRYESVLPEGLMPRFIVETYVHRDPKYVWRTGVVLGRGHCLALVRSDVQGRRITIRVAGVGNGRRELLGIIREHFERIHRSYEQLPVTALVPIPGYPEVEVEHQLLLTYEFHHEGMILLPVGASLQHFRVRDLLDGVDMLGVSYTEKKSSFKFDSSTQSKHLFVAYASEDGRFLDQLLAALVPYERRHELKIWTDLLVEPGQNVD